MLYLPICVFFDRAFGFQLSHPFVVVAAFALAW